MLPDGMIISRLIATRRQYDITRNARVPKEHIHTLTFRNSGRKTLFIDNGQNPLLSVPGSVTYVPRGVGYEEKIEEGGSMYSLHFELVSECDASPFVFIPKLTVEYKNLFSDIFESFYIGNERDYKCMSLFYGLLDAIRRESGEAERRTVPKRIRDAVDEINRSYNDPMLSVSYLAMRAGVSEVYFRKEFFSCMGLSPIKYIKKVRLENARALLSTAVYSVGDVATRCGFDSISYFSEEFRRAYGVPPSRMV